MHEAGEALRYAVDGLAQPTELISAAERQPGLKPSPGDCSGGCGELEQTGHRMYNHVAFEARSS